MVEIVQIALVMVTVLSHKLTQLQAFLLLKTLVRVTAIAFVLWVFAH